MSRKVYLTVKVRVIVDINEGVSVDEINNDLNFDVDYLGDEDVEICDVDVLGYEITDSK